jgi:16S rRNA (cytosine1402-N4)-methyltransferase
MNNDYHTPLFLNEILNILLAKKKNKVIDATFATGGHGINFAKHGIEVLGIEWDTEMYKLGQQRIKQEKQENKITLVKGNFINLSKIVTKYNFDNPDGIVFDFGISMYQIREGKRGFTYEKDEPLDLRINARLKTRANDILNTLSKDMLYELLSKYIESRYIWDFIDNLVIKRTHNKLKTVNDLKQLIDPLNLDDKQKRNLLKQVLQGLRIIVNDELENIKKAVLVSSEIIEKSGLIFFITFHSLEDRIVKQLGKKYKDSLRQFQKPLQNKMYKFARGAKLRVYEKI